jgi:hypothetical protein
MCSSSLSTLTVAHHLLQGELYGAHYKPKKRRSRSRTTASCASTAPITACSSSNSSRSNSLSGEELQQQPLPAVDTDDAPSPEPLWQVQQRAQRAAQQQQQQQQQQGPLQLLQQAWCALFCKTVLLSWPAAGFTDVPVVITAGMYSFEETAARRHEHSLEALFVECRKVLCLPPRTPLLLYQGEVHMIYMIYNSLTCLLSVQRAIRATVVWSVVR